MKNKYRKTADLVAKESWWTIRRYLLLLVVIGALAGAASFTLRSFGIIGKTIVEREVFERSYQRSESLKSQIATEEAALEEINRQLSRPDLDPSTRANLEAQASGIRVRIRAAKGKQ